MLPTVPSGASVPSLISLNRRGGDGLRRKRDRLEPAGVRRDRVLGPLCRVSRLRNKSGTGISANICSGDIFAYLEPGA